MPSRPYLAEEIRDGFPQTGAKELIHSKIKLAIICSPLSVYGGTFRHLLSWCQNIDREKFSVALFCNFINDSHEEIANCQFSSIPELEYHPVHSMFPLSKLLMGGLLQLTRQLKKFAPDIVHSVFIQSDIICALIKPFIGHPVLVSSWEGSLAGKSFHSNCKINLFRALLFFAKFKIDRFIAIASATAEENCHDFGIPREKVCIVHSGLNLDHFPVLPAPPVCATVGLISRLSAEKCVSLFIKAIPAVLSKFPMINFIVAGDGPEKSNIESLASELGVRENIKFTGWCENVAEVLPLINILVFTSSGEGLPWGILEAMASGLPTIASAVGGIPEVISSGQNGLLIEGNNPEAFAEKICLLLQDSKLRNSLATNARQTIENGFTTRHEISAIESEYIKLCKIS